MLNFSKLSGPLATLSGPGKYHNQVSGKAFPERRPPVPVVLYLSVMLRVMKDFVGVLIGLVLVFAAMARVAYLHYPGDRVFCL